MSNTERAARLKKAAKLLTSAASALQHGRVSTALDKLDEAWYITEAVRYECNIHRAGA